MIEDLISPPAQPIDEGAMWLIEAELYRLGVPMLSGYVLPLEPEHAARLLVRALGGPGSGRYPKGSGQSAHSGNLTGPTHIRTTRIDMRAPLGDMKADPRGDTVTMYHVTDIDSAQKIHAEGFKADHPNQFQGFESVVDGTYGWSSLDRARLEVQRVDDMVADGASEMAIIKFEVPASELHRMVPDEDYGDPWQESYDTASAAVKGDVPASWIKETYVDKSAKIRAMSEFELRSAIIRKVDGKYVLFTRDGKRRLGTHDTYGEAAAQEKAIEESVKRHASAHAGRTASEDQSEGREAKISTTPVGWAAESSDSFSEPLRDLGGPGSEGEIKSARRFKKKSRRLASASPIHDVAESHEPKFNVLFRYAFAMGRKAIKTMRPTSADTVTTAATKAMTDALKKPLPKMLHAVASDGGEVGVDLLLDQLRSAASHKHGSTQVNLPPDVAAQMAAFKIPDEDLAADGRETEPHITVKYGVHGTPNDVREALSDEKLAEATLGKTIVFEGVEDGTADAVVIEVHSDCLRRWNKKISESVDGIENTYEYKPHATIAYVKPGLGKKYAGDSRFEGTNLSFDRVVFSSKDDQVVSIPLDGMRAAGGPGSGRYPKGSGQNPQSGVHPVAVSENLSKHKGMQMVSVEQLRRFETQDRRVDPKSSDNITEPTETLLPRLTAELKAGETILEPLTIAYDHRSKKMLLIDGNTRLAAIADAGFTHAPVVVSRQNLHGFGAEVPEPASEEVMGADWVLPSEIGLKTLSDQNPDELRAAGPFRMRFDAKNPSVIKWAKDHAAELIKQITDTTRERIRLAVEELQDEGDWDFYHDRIMAAVGDEARADLIARHETMLAAGKGQRLGWEQATDQGLLTGDERREWIITDDERVCPICSELAGTTAPVNGTYANDIDGPPAHVQCRCTEGIIG